MLQIPATANVNRSDITRVFQTKRELHMFLTVEMEYYLPAVEYTNMEWL